MPLDIIIYQGCSKIKVRQRMTRQSKTTYKETQSTQNAYQSTLTSDLSREGGGGRVGDEKQKPNGWIK